MKMAVITTLYGKYGGTGRVTTEIIERYAKDGNDVYVFCTDFDKELINKTNIKKITKVPVIRKPGILKLLSFTIICTFLVKKSDYDLIYSAGDYYFFPDVMTVHLLRKNSRKIINNLEKLGKVKLNYSKFKRLLRPIYLWFAELPEKIIINNKNVYLTSVSNGLEKELISEYSIPNSRITTIQNGVDINEYNYKNIDIYREKLRKELNISNDDFVILFMGTDWERKGLSLLIQAVSKIDDYKLIIIGIGDQQKYYNYAKKFNCQDKIKFLGYLTHSYKYFTIADVFVFPSLYETFGLVVLEAMATGIPVITTPVYGVQDFVKDKYNGLIIKYDPDDIASKIQFIKNNKNIAKNLSTNALKTAEKFQWDNIYKEYKKLFDNYNRNNRMVQSGHKE